MYSDTASPRKSSDLRIGSCFDILTVWNWKIKTYKVMICDTLNESKASLNMENILPLILTLI